MTDENLIYSKKAKQNSWVYIFLLFLSFVWVSVYPTLLSSVIDINFGYGNIVDYANYSTLFWDICLMALSSWISFEILFWFYRFILSFKIYSFIVPMDSFKAETRIFFIYRNIVLGLFYNLCFLAPYLISFAAFFDMAITLVVLMIYAKHLNSVYADSIVGHFVFKNFCYPVFVYEALCVVYSLGVVLL